MATNSLPNFFVSQLSVNFVSNFYGDLANRDINASVSRNRIKLIQLENLMSFPSWIFQHAKLPSIKNAMTNYSEPVPNQVSIRKEQWYASRRNMRILMAPTILPYSLSVLERKIQNRFAASISSVYIHVTNVLWSLWISSVRHISSRCEMWRLVCWPIVSLGWNWKMSKLYRFALGRRTCACRQLLLVFPVNWESHRWTYGYSFYIVAKI